MIRGRRPPDVLATAAVFVASACFLWSFDPLSRPVALDPATWDYMSLALIDGVLPYRDVFLHKTPAAAFIGAAGASAGPWLGLTRIQGAHAAFVALGAAGPALLFALCRRSMPAVLALAAAAFMLAIDQWTVASVEGVRPKIATTVLGLAALLAGEHRRWAAAGVLGAASTLCWQPGLAFLLGVLWQVRAAQAAAGSRALLRVAVGALVPPALLCAWLVWVGALAEFCAQAIVFNARYIEFHARTPGTTVARFYRHLSTWNPVEVLLLPAAVVGMILTRTRMHGGLLVATLAYLAMAFVSFQAWPDTILFAPAIACVLAAGLPGLLSSGGCSLRLAGVAVAVLAGVAAASPDSKRLSPPLTFDGQAELVRELERGLAADDGVLAVSVPEFLIHTGRHNAWPWPYMWFGVDAFAAERVDGGFDSILASLADRPPALMLVGRRWAGPLRHRFDEWALERYARTSIKLYPHTKKPIQVYRRKKSGRVGTPGARTRP